MIVRIPIIRVPSDHTEGAEFMLIGTRQHEGFNTEEIAKAIVYLYGAHVSIPLLSALIKEFNALGDAMDKGRDAAVDFVQSRKSYAESFEVKTNDC